MVGPSTPAPNGQADAPEPTQSPDAKPKSLKRGRKQPLPSFKPGGLPTHEMHTVAWTMPKGALRRAGWHRAHTLGEELPSVPGEDQTKLKGWIERVRLAQCPA